MTTVRHDETHEEELIAKIASDVARRGGRMYKVGGCVRDKLLKLPSKDIDTETFGIWPDAFERILSQYGPVDLIGKSFGVYRIKGIDVDFSLPRRERKQGVGHKGFVVNVDPFMSPKEASRRRDLTINALMEDVLTGEILDFHGGQQHLRQGIIRHVDDTAFPEDPLRVYRVAQFAARFNFVVATDTISLCKGIDLTTLPKERIYEEFKKLLLKSSRPSTGFWVLRAMGVIKRMHPSLQSLIDCPQSKIHHPEGDVWTHTMMVLNEAAALKDHASDPEVFMWAALTHDLGKPITTMVEGTRVSANGHDEAGEWRAEAFLQTLTQESRIIEGVKPLVRNHMTPFMMVRDNASDGALRRLINRVNLADLLLLAEADHKGRDVADKDCSPMKDWFEAKLARLNMKSDQEIVPVFMGRHLLEMGIQPGPHFAPLLKDAFEMQLDGMSFAEIAAVMRERVAATK